MPRVETFSEALRLVQSEFGVPADYFDSIGWEGEDRFLVGPNDSLPEGSLAFMIYKESGKVRKTSIHDFPEVDKWMQLPTTKEVKL
ncbi:MAG: hypothetical protein SPK00_02940 [Corynebacterium glucuronolyticum]|nr:hypothetical protein [Mycobacteriaceae bacterium]MDY5833695.1 hypothetical protein [Corynebacterium glucuronolyticum]